MLRERFIAYGSRASNNAAPSASKSQTAHKGVETQKSVIVKALDALAAAIVPHTWFTHFYAVSVSLSVFWAVQLLLNGRVLHYVMSKSPNVTGGMTQDQVVLMWILMTTQGARRLYETAMWQKPTQSTMPVGHYMLGIAYYIAMSITIWVEGIRMQRPRVA